MAQMSCKLEPKNIWTWRGVILLFWVLAMVNGSTVKQEENQEDPRVTAATLLLNEDWTGTTVQLLPDMQTETQTEGVTEELMEGEVEVVTQGRTPKNYTGLSCSPVLPPRRGSFFVEGGSGLSVGSILVFWCRDGFQLVGSDKIQCNVKKGKAQWSNNLPICEAIPRPQDRGLRVAVLASVVSGVVILAMSLSFFICCLQERASRLRAKKEGRLRRREKRSSRRSEWEREEGEWESFAPPKIFHLSQRMNPRLAPDSPLYLTGGLSGYENRGYQRSQESLLKASLSGLYRSDSQLYPHVVLQRVPTPTAPSAPPSAPSAPTVPHYLHLPHSSSSAASSPAHTTSHSQSRNQTHMMPQYPTPTYPPNPNTSLPTYPTSAPIYPNPNPVTQRPWQ
ncbi:sushi domain-containing protein 3 [Periophthalmus magnuspinnatus]|uniref:sushi domain-containing protein 3 n=1 Tax=Periophthalmus magnuspinnatus TaxID=409849 RepID=UPI0024372631|nr:sushi domain-containing protein 3 [Periophthalmus magnuspinnatus]